MGGTERWAAVALVLVAGVADAATGQRVRTRTTPAGTVTPTPPVAPTARVDGAEAAGDPWAVVTADDLERERVTQRCITKATVDGTLVQRCTPVPNRRSRQEMAVAQAYGTDAAATPEGGYSRSQARPTTPPVPAATSNCQPRRPAVTATDGWRRDFATGAPRTTTQSYGGSVTYDSRTGATVRSTAGICDRPAGYLPPR